ncbi:hypothetical protein [Gordonia oryzae]|uniref:hypothetical protein n=1 Tax=Gordonia oryzae TaxID=2487349 RepID=UPI001FEB35A2|nr:hypothetical protein [Gordonia oryzae]
MIGNYRSTGRLVGTRLAGLTAIVALGIGAGPHAPALVTTALIAAVIVAVEAAEHRRLPSRQAHA